MPRAMVAGGSTDQVAKAGGARLFNELQMLLAGNEVGACVYALTRSIVVIGLLHDDLAEGSALIRQMAEDSVNELELNWPDREQLIADGAAAMQAMAGRA